MKKHILIAALTTISLFITIISCNKDTPPHRSPNSLKIMTNGSDPLFLRGELQDNTTIELYGTRDVQGLPAKITSLFIKQYDQTFQYAFDDNANLVKIISDDRTEFNLNWISTTQAVVTVISSDGANQLSTMVDFDQQRPANSTIPSNIRKNKKLQLKWKPSNTAKDLSQRKTTNEKGCIIHVTQCSEPVDATVSLIVNDTNNRYLATIPATRIETGIYSANIPNDLAPTLKISDICERLKSVVKSIDGVCGNLNTPAHISINKLCGTISKIPRAKVFGTACTAIDRALQIYCSTLGTTPEGGNESLLAQLMNCQAIPEHRLYTTNLFYYPVAYYYPMDVAGEGVTAPGLGPYPDTYVDVSTTSTIISFDVVPAYPQANESYTATCKIKCLKVGSFVTISVIGTDGYSDSIQQPIIIDQPGGDFTLTVPGAESGVNDIVTVEINMYNGSKITRDVSLVFN